MPDGHDRAFPDSIESERDLYLRILNLGLQDELEPFLREALELVTRSVGAHQGYIEIRDPNEGGGGPCWWAAQDLADHEVEAVRALVSTGIIAESLATGETIVTRSALEDERFEGRPSVRSAEIQAVVCAPIGQTTPLGVVYLQRRLKPGAFTDDDRARVQVFARHVAPYAERLIARIAGAHRDDPTAPYRERLRVPDFIGRSTAIANVLREVALVAPLDVDVLLTGQSGTGKSQLARIIHDNSPRATQPFVELNCAAIPETLIESELFGAAPGAHSTALKRMDGKVAAAQGGTLLLDEVGELAAPAQAKLLQLLQARIYYPLGSARPVRADVRILAATNADLGHAVAEGKFREDLLYRLSVLPIRMPALDERRDDLPELARFFSERAVQRHRLPSVTLSDQLLEALAVADWPGNVRQLAHAVEAATIRAAGAGMLRVERAHIFPSLTQSPALTSLARASRNAVPGATFQEATRSFQAELIRATLEDNGWSVVEAARRLEVARSHLYALIRAFGITRSGE